MPNKAGGYYFVGFSELSDYADSMAGKIIGKRGRPLGIGYIQRGGMVFARLLSDRLGVSNMFCIYASSYPGRGGKVKNFDMQFPDLPENFKARDYLLIVDDISDSGYTLEKAVRGIRMLNSMNVATATAVCKKGTGFVPDFCGIEVEKKYWVVFEYEKEETVSSIKDYKTADVAGNGTIPKWLKGR
jgi:hypoxanthine phosphoribosyltransferase